MHHESSALMIALAAAGCWLGACTGDDTGSFPTTTTAGGSGGTGAGGGAAGTGGATGGAAPGGGGQGGTAGSGQGGGGQGGTAGSGQGGGGQGGCGPNEQEVVTKLTALADAYVDQALPDATFDLSQLVVTRWLPAGKASKRALVRFDLASLPAKTTILNAKLCLTLDLTASWSATLGVHRVTTAWAEANVSWNAPWQKPGGDFVAQASDSSKVAVFDPADTKVCWNVTTDVQALVAAPASNHGWLVRDQEEPQAGNGETQWLAASESATPSRQPRLAVTHCQ
jgi:hypothetical protein